MIARVEFVAVPTENEHEHFVIVAGWHRSLPFGAMAETPAQLTDQAVWAARCRRAGPTSVLVHAHVGPVWVEGPIGCAVVTVEEP